MFSSANLTMPLHYLMREFTVRSYEVDFNCELRLPALFDHLQDVAWEQAEGMGCGWQALQQQGWLWVLSRIDLQVLRLPRWTDTVRLYTWPRGIDGVFALRDFELQTPGGDVLAQATSSWLVLSAQSHRPMRIASLFAERKFVEQSTLGRNADRLVLPADASPEATDEQHVVLGDIDMNQHVNNVRYIDMACNTYGREQFERFSPSGIAVNFNAESQMGETLRLMRYASAPNEQLVAISRASDGKNACTLKFCWSERG